MKQFTHLHLHSVGSLLDGAVHLDKLVDRLKQLNMKSVAITDHGNLYMSYKFWDICTKNNIKPIIGQEFYVVRGDRKEKETREMYHLVLLAKNEIGWRNLCKLSSLAFIEGFYYKPRIDHETVAKYKDGLICLSACTKGELASAVVRGDMNGAQSIIKFYRSIFQGDYYIELMPHDFEEQRKFNQFVMGKLWDDFYNNIVVTNDVHYLRKEDEKYHNYLIKIQTSQGKDSVSKFEFTVRDLYLKDGEEMLCSLMKNHKESFCNEKVVLGLFDNIQRLVDSVGLIKHNRDHKIPPYVESKMEVV